MAFSTSPVGTSEGMDSDTRAVLFNYSHAHPGASQVKIFSLIQERAVWRWAGKFRVKGTGTLADVTLVPRAWGFPGIRPPIRARFFFKG